MKDAAHKMAGKLEDQLAQAIVYLGAIEALSKAFRECESIRRDAFLFRTVYEALWDAIIIRIGTIWDTSKGVISLPKLANELKKQSFHLDSAVIAEIEDQKISEKKRLKEWRGNAVAHTSKSINEIEFDRNNSINATDLRRELDRIERLLASVNKCIDRSPCYFEALKEDAKQNAESTINRMLGPIA